MTNVISNQREWNNCLAKFSALVYLEFKFLFHWIFIKKKKNDRKLMWQKKTKNNNNNNQWEIAWHARRV